MIEGRAGPTPAARAWRWTQAQIPFLIVVLGIAAAFVYLCLTTGHWLRSTGVMAVVLLLAAVMRLVLPAQRVGLLAVRKRWVDTLAYALLGGLILATDLRLHK